MSGLASSAMRYAIIIGAQKCGTTALFEYLRQHPQICPCTMKEPRFFASQYHKDDRWLKGFDWYESLYNWEAEEHKWALEASTTYTRVGPAKEWELNNCPGGQDTVVPLRQDSVKHNPHIDFEVIGDFASRLIYLINDMHDDAETGAGVCFFH